MMPPRIAEKNAFFRVYDLVEKRRQSQHLRQPAPHQSDALKRLKAWSEAPVDPANGRGGLLVLPTGGGKTFTAVRYICEWPLSEGYKVLWLAHTHHLLEQAFETFGPHSETEEHVGEAAAIREPREQLRVRVVSGMPGHSRVQSISSEDDVVIGSLQSIAGAHREDHASLLAFLRAAGDKLFVVFDEAHHAPAPTYARFVEALRHKIRDLHLLGLTATPVYENKLRKGWLARLFPQGIVYQTTANQLMAAKVLARPDVREFDTRVEASFDDTEFARWIESYTDLPERIVEGLAKNTARNDFIIKTYVDNRAEFGKTLIFADRWYQCDYLREGLLKHGVRADVVYSHVDAKERTVEARNRRTADENTKVIRAFKRNELDVLINVRMLTEGTDVPSIQTVFLTRQTTSRVLLTQMVGRALRGPKFGGTERAYVVSFIDKWKQLINWAEFSLTEGLTDEKVTNQHARLPVRLVSIELVRQLAAQMYKPANERPATFIQLLPVGWFRVQFDAQLAGTEEIEHLERLVLVYDADRKGFEGLMAWLETNPMDHLADPNATLEHSRAALGELTRRFFPEPGAHLGGELINDVFHVARHMAQSQGERPQFFPFEQRDSHDLDILAQSVFERNVGRRELPLIVQAEFERPDRFWRAIYGSIDLFRDQFELRSRRIENELLRGGQPTPRVSGGVTYPENHVEVEPPEETKRAVKERDGWRCLCCGSTNKKHLEVDHVIATYHGGGNDLPNLQTLCRRCNTDKGVNEQNFLVTTTTVVAAHSDFEPRLLPTQAVNDPLQWERAVRATLNHYFRCAAVSRIDIGARGRRFHEWLIVLSPGNDPRFLEPHLEGLLALVCQKRSQAGYQVPSAILVEGSDSMGGKWATRVETGQPPASASR